MEDRVLDERFGKVYADVDTEDEVFITVLAEEALFAAGEGDFAEEGAGVGEFDADRRKGTGKETGVVLVKTGLYVRNRWFHL